MGSVSIRRQEMGEDAWLEYQRQRNNEKVNRYLRRNVDKVVNWRRRTKWKLIEYKGGMCEICKYDKPFPSAYCFHHVADNKEFGISGKTIKFERLKAEADKCQLLCVRCHGELHDKQYDAQREKTTAKLKDDLKEKFK